MADPDDPTDTPVDGPPVDKPAAPPADEPSWAASLRQAIEELPGKLTATVTPDDRKGIAEDVYGLFERGGAFIKGEPSGEPSADDPANPPAPSADENPPQKGGKLSKFASRFAGEGGK